MLDLKVLAKDSAERWSEVDHAPEYRDKNHPRHFIVDRAKKDFVAGFLACAELMQKGKSGKAPTA